MPLHTEHLLLVAQEEIDRLYNVVREAGYTLLFCDTAGVAVEHRGDEADASRFKYWGTWLGGVWSEAIEGTNGIGTCIAEERPITIHRNQHFRSRHTDLSCSTAPVFGVDGSLMAVLDVSAIDPERSERAHALTGALTASAARSIEERFFRGQFREGWIIATMPPEEGTRGMLLAIDGNQRIIAQTGPPAPPSCSTNTGCEKASAYGPYSTGTRHSFEAGMAGISPRSS
jgi:transcriptional regulator of acetoin/glycerol metabolism